MNKHKIYGKSKGKFYLVAEDNLKDIWDFKLPKKHIDFIKNKKGNYKLEDDEIFFIEIEEEIEEYLTNIRFTSNCNTISREALTILETLYVFDGNDGNFKLYIQRVMPSCRIKKPFISFSEEKAYVEKNKLTIFIKKDTDIFWEQKSKKIYFKKFSDLESVFKCLSKYYREAKKEDFQKLQNKDKYPFLDIQNIDFDNLQKTKLKTIALIVDELDKVKDSLDEYLSYTKKYKPNFLIDNKFQITRIEDIDNLSDIVFRKIYTTEAGKEEIRKANSYKVITINAK